MFSHKSFEQMGIQIGYGFQQLIFSQPASTLIVQARSAVQGWRPKRLYSREISSEKYQPIGEPDYLISQESPFVHSSKPLLAYNCMRHSFRVDIDGEERHSGDWDSLKVFDLKTAKEIESIDEHSLQFPCGVVRGWIAGIVAFCDSGLFVSAGLSKHASQMDYFVAELDLKNRALNLVTELPAVFM